MPLVETSAAFYFVAEFGLASFIRRRQRLSTTTHVAMFSLKIGHSSPRSGLRLMCGGMIVEGCPQHGSPFYPVKTKWHAVPKAEGRGFEFANSCHFLKWK
jgi:hypothetical protein